MAERKNGYIEIPQAIDPHVHDRGFSESHKGTPESETIAALAGGYAAILSMPNNNPPIVDYDSLKQKLFTAKISAHTFYGAFLAGVKGNQEMLTEAEKSACGLKVYLDNTTGSLFVRDLNELKKHFQSWPGEKPICVHAEELSLSTAIGLAAVYGKPLHVCHVSRESEISLIKDAKERGLPITCEVTPHHLFLTEDDLPYLGNFGLVKPELATCTDQKALWDNIDNGVIDCIASDHAPHTTHEKQSDNPPYGIPGLETTLPLMLGAVEEGRLSLEKLIDLVSTNPRKIFHIPNLGRGTYAVVDLNDKYYLNNSDLKTQAGWSPYTAHKLTGRIREVYLNGELVYKDGEVLPRYHKSSLVLFQNN